MTHCQNLDNPQQGNRAITDYMQDVKHNIDSLALMNVSIDFDELSIHVLNGLDPAYSNIFHALQVRETPITFQELFEQLLSYEAQMKILVPLHHPLPPRSLPWLRPLALHKIASPITMTVGTITSLNSRGHHPPIPYNTCRLHLHDPHDLQLH